MRGAGQSIATMLLAAAACAESSAPAPPSPPASPASPPSPAPADHSTTTTTMTRPPATRTGFRPPDAAARRRALGETTLFSVDGFDPVHDPEPGDWLAE